MLVFETAVKVVERLEGEVEINGYVFNKYLTTVGDVEIIVISTDSDLPIGKWVKSGSTYLTSIREDGKKLTVLRMERPVVMDDDFKGPKDLEVRCNGKIVKPKNNAVQFLGVAKRPFYPCTLIVRNECGLFKLFVRGSYQKAYELRDIPDQSYINCTGVLRPKQELGVYDLSFKSYEAT